jgi:hypothetical protein
MKPMHIDFAPHAGWWNAGSDKANRPLWWVICGLLIAAVFMSAFFAWQLDREKAIAMSSRASVQAALDRAGQGDEQADMAKIESAEAIAHASLHLNYPWATLISSLERNTRPGVNVLSMEFGLVRQSNKLVVEASELAAGLDYLEALKGMPGFDSVALMRQEAVSVDGSPRIRFTLEAPQPVAPARTARNEGGAQ